MTNVHTIISWLEYTVAARFFKKVVGSKLLVGTCPIHPPVN